MGQAFRKSLVNVCQATFERNLQPPPTFADLTADERLEEEIKLKICRLGNMRFIGELLARRLLAPKLMLPIVHELITGDSAAQEDSLHVSIAMPGVMTTVFHRDLYGCTWVHMDA